MGKKKKQKKKPSKSKDGESKKGRPISGVPLTLSTQRENAGKMIVEAKLERFKKQNTSPTLPCGIHLP